VLVTIGVVVVLLDVAMVVLGFMSTVVEIVVVISVVVVSVPVVLVDDVPSITRWNVTDVPARCLLANGSFNVTKPAT